MSASVFKYCYVFRALTLLFATTLYILGDVRQVPPNILIISFMIIAYGVLFVLYSDTSAKDGQLKYIISIELVGTIAVLIPTGGIQSPYFWLLLNPVLMGLIKIKDRRKDVVLMGCYVGVLSICAWISGDVFEFVHENTNLIFAYSTIMASILLLSKYLDEVRFVRCDLESALKDRESFIENMMHSIELIEHISNVDQKSILNDSLTRYLHEMFPEVTCAVIDTNHPDQVNVFGGVWSDHLTKLIQSNYNNERQSELQIMSVQKAKKLIYAVPSSFKDAFRIVLYVSDDYWIKHMDMIQTQILFIKKLQNIILTKLELLKFSQALLISEEQDRIAREMHDQVNQGVFAASCMAYNFMKTTEGCESSMCREKSQKLYSLLNEVNKDIKNIVYRLSNQSSENMYLETFVKSYINELAYVYNVEVRSTFDNAYVLLNSSLKNSIFRIITECFSNSIRHGGASCIDVDILRNKDELLLCIKDDGCGFNVQNDLSPTKGIGLLNLEQIAQEHDGYLSVQSDVNQGTEVKMLLKLVGSAI